MQDESESQSTSHQHEDDDTAAANGGTEDTENGGAVEPSAAAPVPKKKKKSKKAKSKTKKGKSVKGEKAAAAAAFTVEGDQKDEESNGGEAVSQANATTSTGGVATEQQQPPPPQPPLTSKKKQRAQANRTAAEAVLTKKAKRKPTASTTNPSDKDTDGMQDTAAVTPPTEPEETEPVARPGAYAMDRPAPVYVMEDESSEDEEENVNDPHAVGSMEQPQTQLNAPVAFLTADVQVTTPVVEEDKPDILEAQVALAQPMVKEEDEEDGSGERAWGTHKKLYMYGGFVLLLLVIIIVVVAVVVAGGGGGDNNGTPTTTPSPTLSPTTPDEVETECYTNTRTIVNTLLRRPNFDDLVEIEICQGAEVEVSLSQRFDPAAGIAPAIPVQSNMELRCGEDGLLQDACIIRSGNTLLLNIDTLSQELAATNVVIEGITFEDGSESLVELTNGGDITFRNCLFRRSSSATPIHVNFEGHESDPSIRQTVTFEDCVFEDITYSALTSDEYDVAAMIAATTDHNTVVLRRCTFRNLAVNDQSLASVITSFGAEVVVEDSCFFSYDGGTSSSPVLRISTTVGEPEAPVSGSGNFVSSEWLCPLIGDLQTDLSLLCDGAATEPAASCTVPPLNVFW